MRYIILLTLLGLVACSSKPATPANPNNPTNPSPTNPTLPVLSPEEANRIALGLWRNDDLTKHPKGSCAGCHGADFFDLARIGSTDTDLLRRAKIDGATEAEAAALVQAITQQRRTFNLPPTNARTFRPFQPGGQVLLPNLNDPPHIQAVKRDIAFGKQLEQLLPTLFGARIDSLAKAQQAKEELLDLARGTSLAGRNTQNLNLRTLPAGILYPLWSADLHHGASEGTLNDWVADIAHDAKPDKKAEWHALQDTYLKTPSNENFWKMYRAALDMTRVPLLGPCTMDGINPALACGAVTSFNQDKFLSALIGQHMLRLEALGQSNNGFTQGALAFSYLDKDPRFSFMLDRPNFGLLPANMWEIGDRGRVMLDESSKVGTFRGNLRKLGYPEFAQNSVDVDRTESQEQHALRLFWFWSGFTFDASFARIHGSNSTKVGEYMVGTLIDERLFIHNAFSQNLRLVAKGFLPEANVIAKTKPNRIENVAPEFVMHYSYFIGYNREILDREWNESTKAGITFPQPLKDEQNALWGRLVSNGFRMSLYLQAAAWPSLKPSSQDFLRGIFADTTDANGVIDYGTLGTIEKSLNHYQPQHLAADDVLLDELRTLSGVSY
jgi:hypothetical protein